MPTREPVDPFGGDENKHILYKHLMDYVKASFNDRELPAHVEQYIMLFFVGEVGIDMLSESMVQARFADKDTARKGNKLALKEWNTNQKGLVEKVGKGEFWTKGL